MNQIEQINKTRILFGIAVCFMYAACLASLLFIPIPEANRSSVDILTGSLNIILGWVFGYYFGTSDGSHRKSQIIRKMKEDNVEEELTVSFEAEKLDMKDTTIIHKDKGD